MNLDRKDAGAPLSGPGVRTKGTKMLDQVMDLGEFAPRRELVRNGPGRLFEAIDARGRLVMLLVSTSADPVERLRWIRGARIWAKLCHPNIPAIDAVSERGDALLLAFRHVRGEPMLPGSLDPPRAARVVRDVARAVHHLHEEGFVHRAISPANVLLDQEGTPMLVGFESASEFRTAERPFAPCLLAERSPYAAPERLRAHADRRTDVYSLGALLGALATGRIGTSALLPDALAAVRDRAMAPLPEDRYATARDLADALERASNDPRRSWLGALFRTWTISRNPR